MDDTIGYLERLWRDAKGWRSLRFGPLTIHLRLSRTHRRLARSIAIPPATQDRSPRMASSGTALVVGIGEEIGPAVVQKLASEGMQVAALSRSTLAYHGSKNIRGYQCDVTDERAVRKVLADVSTDMTVPSLMVYGVQGWAGGRVLDVQVSAFEEAWRANCLGAFIVAQQTARAMRKEGRGTIVFLGSTSDTVARSGYLSLAVGKYGLRALAQVMARELGPAGIHVVHLIIDADVRANADEDAPNTHPTELAELIWSLHLQPRSAWTQELDVRPYNEAFWEHC